MPPGYRYLGPGNSLDVGDPTNEADALEENMIKRIVQYWQLEEDRIHNGVKQTKYSFRT